ncbi:MAG TPA: hypothetical protein VNQ90_15455 [Chthoniobacteraceae bacterium]|nr:hypothetical protein [Chthoniobacteraceae bacterium]
MIRLLACCCLLLGGVFSAAASSMEALAPVMESAVLYHDFARGESDPLIGAFNGRLTSGAEIVAAKEGKALRTRGGGVLETHDDLPDLTRPGSLSFWVSPRGWEWGDERPYNRLLSFSGAEGASIQITRVGLLRRPGEAVARLDRLLLLFHRLPGEAANRHISLGATDETTWVDGSWHLFVLSWNGAAWSLSVDAGPPKRISLSRPLDADTLDRFALGGSEEPTLFRHLALYRKELNEEEIATLYQHQHP